MAEVYGEGTAGLEVNGGGVATTTPLNVSGSFKEGPKSSSRRQTSVRPSFDADNEFMTLLHGSDSVKVELNRLENEDKDRELGDAQAEIKALRLSERLREKAVEEGHMLLFWLLLFWSLVEWTAPPFFIC